MCVRGEAASSKNPREQIGKVALSWEESGTYIHRPQLGLIRLGTPELNQVLDQAGDSVQDRGSHETMKGEGQVERAGHQKPRSAFPSISGVP